MAKKKSYKAPVLTTALGVPVGIDLPSPSDAVNWAAGVVSSGRIAGGQTQAVTPGEKGLRTLGQGISMANTALNPYAETTRKALGAAVNRDRQSTTELYRSATLDALLTGGALGVGVGVQKGLNAVADSGIPARIGNAIRGEKVIVHASPTKGMTFIQPHAGSNQLPDDSVVFGWDPQRPGMDYRITRAATPYLTKNETGELGSFYVGKIKKNQIVTPPQLQNSAQVVSSGPAKVVAEIPALNKPFAQLDSEVKRQLRLAGASPKPQVSRTADAVERTKKKIRQSLMTQEQKEAERLRSFR